MGSITTLLSIASLISCSTSNIIYFKDSIANKNYNQLLSSVIYDAGYDARWDYNIYRENWYIFKISVYLIDDYIEWIPLEKTNLIYDIDLNGQFHIGQSVAQTITYTTAESATFGLQKALTEDFSVSASFLSLQAEAMISYTIEESTNITYQNTMSYAISKTESIDYTIDVSSPNDYGIYSLVFGMYGGSLLQLVIEGDTHYVRTTYNGITQGKKLDSTFSNYRKEIYISAPNQNVLNYESYGYKLIYTKDWEEYNNWIYSYPIYS